MLNDKIEKKSSLTDAVLNSALETVKVAGKLEDGVSFLKTSASHQEKKIHSIIATVDDGVASLRQFADNAASLASTIAQTASRAQNSQSLVDQLSTDAAVLADQASRSASFLTELSSLITGIIRDSKKIQDAAQDISVIAINTAIEAARAGDHGKGFAVISREIRKLSERSGQLSQAIVKNVEHAGKQINDVRKAVLDSSESAANASQTALRFKQEFAAIASDSFRTNESVSSFRKIAHERYEAEQKIAAEVRSIAGECENILEQTDKTVQIVCALKSSTEKTLAAVDPSKSSMHKNALEAAVSTAASISASTLVSHTLIDSVLEKVFMEDSPFELLYVMDARGKQVSSNIAHPSRRSVIGSSGYGADRAEKDYYKIPFSTKRPYVSSAYISTASGALCITAAVPVLDKNGSVAGILAADINAANLE